VKAPILYRISSVLLLLFALGHTFGFRQNNPEWGADAVLGSMRSVHFDAQGFTRTYWDFFSAFGLFFSVFLLFAAVLKHCVGARHRLCSNHSFKLAIRLHYPHHFLNPGQGQVIQTIPGRRSTSKIAITIIVFDVVSDAAR